MFKAPQELFINITDYIIFDIFEPRVAFIFSANLGCIISGAVVNNQVLEAHTKLFSAAFESIGKIFTSVPGRDRNR